MVVWELAMKGKVTMSGVNVMGLLCTGVSALHLSKAPPIDGSFFEALSTMS